MADRNNMETAGANSTGKEEDKSLGFCLQFHPTPCVLLLILLVPYSPCFSSSKQWHKCITQSLRSSLRLKELIPMGL